MRVVIIANGELNTTIDVNTNDIVIAADGGTRMCQVLNIEPHFVIGDLDSLDQEDIDFFRKSKSQIILHPQQKDETDLELAVKQAVDLSPSEIIIFAALGARWDQTIANLLLPSIFPSIPLSIVDGDQIMFYLHGGKTLEIKGVPGDIVSLIPLGGDAVGITTKGLLYPLDSEDLHHGFTRGVSNILLNSSATISLQEGLLICVVIHQG